MARPRGTTPLQAKEQVLHDAQTTIDRLRAILRAPASASHFAEERLQSPDAVRSAESRPELQSPRSEPPQGRVGDERSRGDRPDPPGCAKMRRAWCGGRTSHGGTVGGGGMIAIVAELEAARDRQAGEITSLRAQIEALHCREVRRGDCARAVRLALTVVGLARQGVPGGRARGRGAVCRAGAAEGRGSGADREGVCRPPAGAVLLGELTSMRLATSLTRAIAAAL